MLPTGRAEGRKMVINKWGRKQWTSIPTNAPPKPSPAKKKGRAKVVLATRAAKSKTKEPESRRKTHSSPMDAPVATKTPAASGSRVQELLDTAFNNQQLSHLTIALVLDGLQKTNNHSDFAALLHEDTPLEDYNDAITRAMKSTTMLDQGLTVQQPAITGLMHADCVRKSTDERPLKGPANNNACCRNDTGKARCSVCMNVVCVHHCICEHQAPKRCPRSCTCSTCKRERSVHFVQRYREPARGAKPTFVAPPVTSPNNQLNNFQGAPCA